MRKEYHGVHFERGVGYGALEDGDYVEEMYLDYFGEAWSCSLVAGEWYKVEQ